MPKEKKKGKTAMVRTSQPKASSRSFDNFRDRKPRRLIMDPRWLSVALPVGAEGAAFCVFNALDGAAQTRQARTLHKLCIEVMVVAGDSDTQLDALPMTRWRAFNLCVVRSKIADTMDDILERTRGPQIVFTGDPASSDEAVAQGKYYAENNTVQRFMPTLNSVSAPNYGAAYAGQLNQLTPAGLQQAVYQSGPGFNVAPNTPAATAAQLLSTVEPALIKTYLVQKDILASKCGAVYRDPSWQKTKKFRYETEALGLPELYNVWVTIKPSFDTNLIAYVTVNYELDNN